MTVARRVTRTGTILISVLTCLLVALSLVATSIHMSLRCRRQGKLAQQMVQTELLVEAGFLRARERLRSSAVYAGEVWQLANEQYSLGDATVSIAVEAPSTAGATAAEGLVQVTVTAHINASYDSHNPTQRSQTLNLKLSQLSSAE